MADVKPDMSEPMNIKVKPADKEAVMFKVKKGTKMKKIMVAYASHVQQAVGSVRFMFDGKRVEDDNTPESMGLEDGDQIDAFIDQIGGRS